MKDRNTSIFYFMFGILSLVFAFTAPFTVPFFKLLIILASIFFFLLGFYSYFIVLSKRKSAFTVSRIKKEKELKTVPHPHLAEAFTERSLKRQ